MKKFILLLFTVHCSLLTATSQTCEQCSTRRILFYDNVVNAAPEDSTKEGIQNYWKLFLIAKGVRNYFMNDDASRNCYTFLDGAFYTTNDSLPQTGIKFGPANANVPPPGAIQWSANAEYIIYGNVSGSKGIYSVTLYLETGKTREVAKTASIQYTFNNDPIETGKSLASQLSPLYQTIMDFEKKKRDEGEPHAVYPRIEFSPSKESLGVNEKTDIEIKLIDCDDVTLEDRKIEIQASDGSLDKEYVTTDADGKATIEFTAGNQPALAEIRGVCPYQKGSGDMHTARNHPHALYIPIEKPKDNWLIKGNYYWDINTTKETTLMNVSNTSVNSTKHKNASFGGYIKLKSNSESVFETNSKPESFNFSGDYLWNYSEHSQASGECWFSDSQTSDRGNASSLPSSNPIFEVSRTDGISILLDSLFGHGNVESTTINMYVSCYDKNTTTDGDKWDSNEPFKIFISTDSPNDTSYSNTIKEEENGKLRVATSSVTQKCKYAKNSLSITYKFSGDAKWTNISGSPDPEIEKENISLNVTLSNSDISYISEPLKENNFSWLRQNFPNPVSQSTVISYQLSEKNKVSLKLYDLLGNKVKILVNSNQDKGKHYVWLDVWDFADGIYYYSLTAGNYTQTRKMIVMK